MTAAQECRSEPSQTTISCRQLFRERCSNQRFADASSHTASANCLGDSLGRLCPTSSTMRCERDPLNFDADDLPSLAGTTPSALPSKVMVGTGMAGSAASRLGMYHNVDIVGVVERACVPIECSLVEAPVRRVANADSPCNLASVGLSPARPGS